MRTQIDRKSPYFLGQHYARPPLKYLDFSTLLLLLTLYTIYDTLSGGSRGNTEIPKLSPQEKSFNIMPYLYWNNSVSQTPVDTPHGASKRFSVVPNVEA